MQDITRRSAVALSLAAAASVPPEARAQGAGGGASQFKETQRGPGVVQRDYTQERSLVPGFQTVSMRDLILEPGAMFKPAMPMANAMSATPQKASYRSTRTGARSLHQHFTFGPATRAPRSDPRTEGNVRAVMRITDLKA